MTHHARPVGSFCWNELGTTDPAAAKSFYTSLFGWSTEDRDMGEMGTYTMLRHAGKDVGGLYALSGPMFEGMPSHWGYYVAVDDVDDVMRRAAELGAKEVQPPMDVHDVGRMAMLEDPTGAMVSVFQGTGEHGASADPQAPGMFCWTELWTKDPKRAIAFYSELFGWKTKPSTTTPLDYTELMLRSGPPFGGIMKMKPEQGDAPPAWIGYINVKDCDACVKKAKKLGGQVCMPPMDVENVGRFSVISDPTGAMFAVIQLS